MHGIVIRYTISIICKFSVAKKVENAGETTKNIVVPLKPASFKNLPAPSKRIFRILDWGVMKISRRGWRGRCHQILSSTYSRHTIYTKPSDINSIRNTMRSIANIKSNSQTSLKYFLICSAALFTFIVSPTNGDGNSSLKKLPTATGRNIHNLSCISRHTGETGICMFAYTCARANGTHLGTCIDRFYFGSCCRMNTADDDTDIVNTTTSNYLKKDNASITESLHQKPTSHTKLPFTISTILYSPPVRPTPELFANMFIKPGNIFTNSSISYNTVPTPSKTPLNFTFSQLYSTPTTHVTAPSLIYSTTISQIFQSANHRPESTSYSTLMSKVPSKPPVKPKPSQESGKPSSIKHKPNKPITRPTLMSQSLFSTSTESISSSFINKTTIDMMDSMFNSRPMITSVQDSIPTKTTTVTLFTSSKKPIKPATSTTHAPASSYSKIPTVSSTIPPSHPPQAVVALSTTYVSSTFVPEISVSFEQNFKINNTLEEEDPQKPYKPWDSTSTHSFWPWTMPSSSSPSSQAALVTWTSIDELPDDVIPTDRSKPTSIIKPSGPFMTTPDIIPSYSKPLMESTDEPSKPANLKPPGYEENYHPSTSTSNLSPDWVEISVTTHAPSHSTFTQTEPEEDEELAIIAHTSSKPNSSIAITAAGPLPVEATPVPALETNEINSLTYNMSDYRDVCGRRFVQTARIVGGSKATFGKWPWQVSLRQWRTSTYLHKCGAALFNENWAVTAAHCVENVPPGDLLLRLGEYDLSAEDEPYSYQERRVQIVASHPQFDPGTFEHDLALLRFYEPVQFQPNIIPICVPEDDNNFVGSEAFVTGWGRLYEDGPLPSILQEVSVPIINNSACESMYRTAGYIEHIPNIFICGGWMKGGYDSCEGDSGGPLVAQRPDKRWLLVGIISWGIGCAEPNQPGVYTRISAFREWINQILQF